VNQAGSSDFVQPSDCPTGNSLISHATHVAGIAAASYVVQPNNSGDIVGGAPSARLLSLRALNGAGCGSDADIAAAFSAAGAAGARVVNASLGGAGYSKVLDDAIASYPNTLFVVAAGNGDARHVGYDEDTHGDYPCADPAPNVVCVAAVDNTGRLAGFSNFGATSVDVGAPGVDIRSYVAGGSIQPWDGTSMATPFVSAAAALAFSANPQATPSQVRQAMITTARPLDSPTEPTVSDGIIDAAKLVKAVASLPAPQPPAATPAPAPPAAPAPAAAIPAPVSAPARVLASPRLSLHKPRRRGRNLAVSGHVTRSFHGKVTIRVCAGRRCRTVRVRVRSGRFAAKVRPARRGRVVVSASVAAGGGFKAARVKRAVRF
jgi:subtilisin family serine protease